jgi:hypothetical protein
MFCTIFTALVVIIGAGAVIWLLPNRTAAIILGLVAASELSRYALARLLRTTQIAIMWLSIGVVAGAAYAKLNDQALVTIASVLVSFAQSLVKLLDILIRSVGIAGSNIRTRIVAVTPDFIWPLIPATMLLLIIDLAGRQRNSSARPELRRAA